MTTSTVSAMKITKLSPHIGAEVTGIDLRQPIDAETRRRLNEAVVENIALVVRDQHFDAPQFLAAASIFGEPSEQDPNKQRYSVPEAPLVRVVSSRHTDKNGNRVKPGARWHTDHTNMEVPPKYTILYALELPESGGDTNVANTRAGYESLPEDMKQRIVGMQTVNVYVASVAKHHDTDREAIQATIKPQPILQPLVRTNPDNGTKAVYFHPNKTENIVGMDPEASQVLLDDLVGRLLQPEFIYSHKWRKGDMFLWDNRSSLHKASFDYDPAQHRKHYRVHIKGERAQ